MSSTYTNSQLCTATPLSLFDQFQVSSWLLLSLATCVCLCVYVCFLKLKLGE